MEEKEQLIGEIILKFNQVEFYLKRILIKYLKPDKSKEKLYSQVLFNNSIISFNSKLKLFKHINSHEKWISGKESRGFFDDMHYLNNIRNSLVHTENAFEIVKDEKGKVDKIYDIIDFFKPNGDFDTLRLNEVYENFSKRYVSSKKILIDIFGRL